MTPGEVARRRLSKSSYLLGRQCSKRLWLWSRRVPERSIDDDDPAADFEEQSREVERVGEILFPGGVRVDEGSDDASDRFEVRVERTSRLVGDPLVPAIFQAHLMTDRCLSVVDALERRPSAWFIHEFKASSATYPIFHFDLAFQWLVAERAGLHIEGAGVIRLDPSYVYDGAHLEPERLLVREDLTQQISQILPQVRLEIEAQLALMEEPISPDVRPGSHCTGSRKSVAGNRPSDCGHLALDGVCGSTLPANWSFRLPRISKGLQLSHIRMPGNDRIEALDAEDPTLGWSDSQARVIRSVQRNEVSLDQKALAQGLNTITWPVAYMDFEFEPAIAVPRFAGMQPNQRLPFQWSVRVQAARDAELGPPLSFLHEDKSDPRERFIESLIAALPPFGSIVVHSQNAEVGVLNRYEQWFAGRHWPACQLLIGRICDTCKIADAGYYHSAQKGSYSIKSLAPALLGTGYEDLDIQGGMAAVRAWRELIGLPMGQPGSVRLREQLLAYCDRDAELMHRILEAFRGMLA